MSTITITKDEIKEKKNYIEAHAQEFNRRYIGSSTDTRILSEYERENGVRFTKFVTYHNRITLHAFPVDKAGEPTSTTPSTYRIPLTGETLTRFALSTASRIAKRKDHPRYGPRVPANVNRELSTLVRNAEQHVRADVISGIVG